MFLYEMKTEVIFLSISHQNTLKEKLRSRYEYDHITSRYVSDSPCSCQSSAWPGGWTPGSPVPRTKPGGRGPQRNAAFYFRVRKKKTETTKAGKWLGGTVWEKEAQQGKGTERTDTFVSHIASYFPCKSSSQVKWSVIKFPKIFPDKLLVRKVIKIFCKSTNQFT